MNVTGDSLRGRPAARVAFALGLALRPIVVLPLLASSPSPWILFVGVVISVLLAVGVFAGKRLAIAFGLYVAAMTAATPILFGSLGWPPVWLWINAAYGVLLLVLGVLAWRTRRAD